jgi:hypothetical protein
MEKLIYVPIGKGMQIGVPANLTPTEISERVKAYKMSLQRSVETTYNPQTRGFTKVKI